MTLIQRNSILHRPVVHEVQAGEERGTGGATGHGVAEVVPKGHAFTTETVDVGCGQKACAQDGQEISTPLVNDSKKYVLKQSYQTYPIDGLDLLAKTFSACAFFCVLVTRMAEFEVQFQLIESLLRFWRCR